MIFRFSLIIIHLCITCFDEEGKLFTLLYDKHDDFDFPMVNFPYLGSNISESLHMVFLFHRPCSQI